MKQTDRTVSVFIEYNLEGALHMSDIQFTRRGMVLGSGAAVLGGIAGATITRAGLDSSPADVTSTVTEETTPVLDNGVPPKTEGTYRLAAVQAEPVWYDLDATLEKTIALMTQAHERGADIVAFGETWLPGYPTFMWLGDETYREPLRATYLENSPTVGGQAHRSLEQASKELGITVALGVSERDGDNIYMGTWLIDNGTTLHTQRKLKPSGPEWDIFHSGTVDGYAVVPTSVGLLGALSCNENRRPLVRNRYYRAGEQLHVAAWPSFAIDIGIWGMTAQCSMESSAQYAGEGGVTTIAPTSLTTQAYFDKYPLPAGSEGRVKIGGGSAMIFDPGGKPLAEYLGPATEGIVYADVESATITEAAAGDYDPAPFTIAADGMRPSS